MHLLLLKFAFVTIVTKIDCSIDGWTYMNPNRQQNPPYGPYRSRNGPSKGLYWYPQPTPNLYYKVQYQPRRPERLKPCPAQPQPSNPRLIPPSISFPIPPIQIPPVPVPPFPIHPIQIPHIPIPPFPIPPIPIPLIPIPHYAPSIQLINSSTPELNNPSTLKPTNYSTISPTLSTPTTQNQQVNVSVPSSVQLPSLPQLSVPLPMQFPLISNIDPAIPQPSSQLTNFPIFPQPFPMPPPLSIPPVPQVLPGLPGLVSSDGGINIMPFSDVYSDIYEKFKNKVARKELRKLVRKFRNLEIQKYRMEFGNESEERDTEEEEMRQKDFYY